MKQQSRRWLKNAQPKSILLKRSLLRLLRKLKHVKKEVSQLLYKQDKTVRMMNLSSLP